MLLPAPHRSELTQSLKALALPVPPWLLISPRYGDFLLCSHLASPQ